MTWNSTVSFISPLECEMGKIASRCLKRFEDAGWVRFALSFFLWVLLLVEDGPCTQAQWGFKVNRGTSVALVTCQESADGRRCLCRNACALGCQAASWQRFWRWPTGPETGLWVAVKGGHCVRRKMVSALILIVIIICYASVACGHTAYVGWWNSQSGNISHF